MLAEMDEQTRIRIYQTTSLIAGLAAIGAMVLIIIAGTQPGFRPDIRWSACCYIAMLGSVTSIVAAILGRNLKALQAIVVVLSILILPFLLLMDALRRESGTLSCSIYCRDDQRRAFYQLTRSPSPTFPASVADCNLPGCTTSLDFPPWSPPVYRPVGMNVYIAKKKLKAIPDLQRTVFIADCLPADGRIRGSRDIDWTRHGSTCNIMLCDGLNWQPAICKREELIFNPWPSNAPRSPSPPAHSHPAPPASRRP